MPGHGERRRREILGTAIDLSSAGGLSGLSIGRLARETGMSKSGLFAHFGSKENLQLATVRLASERYEHDILAPAQNASPGLARLEALMEHWIASIAETSDRGGCFFDAASTEFGSRPGPVRDLLASLCRAWIRRLEENACIAVRCGELAPDVDPELLAFQLHAYVEEANWAHQLLADPHSFDRARRATSDTLSRLRNPRPGSPGDTR